MQNRAQGNGIPSGHQSATLSCRIDSAEQWLLYRRLRNQMIHEYIEDNQILTNALKSGQSFVPTMLETATTLIQETESRLT